MTKNIENDPMPLARRDRLLVRELPDESLVYDLRDHRAHCLNRTAAFVWSRCDGRSTPEEIAELMEKEWQSPVNVDAVWFTLDKLSKAGLLQERMILPQAKAGMSRRSAIRRLGVGALMIPVVMTIVAPTAMAGASIPPPCQVCIKHLDTGTNCPSECGPTVLGSCFKNDGCGAGRLSGNFTCQQCQALALHPLSWTAP